MLHSRPPLQRMLHIHAAIQGGGFPNAADLSEELEITSRTVYRDMDFMRDRLGLPIEYSGSKRGFYYTQEVGSFPSMQISEGELFAMLVAEKALQQYRGTPFEKPLLSAFKKVSESLPDTISLNLNEWDDSISFRTSAEPILNLENFDRLSRAIGKKEQLRLEYRKPGAKEAEERIVDPYHLANVNGEWFLFAYDQLRKAIRTFVPARILSIEPTGIKFKRDPKFSIEKELRNSFGVHSGKGQIEVAIRFDTAVADYIREKKWHPSQKLRTLRNGDVELKMTLSSLVEVERWVLGWGGSARVVGPVELAQRLHAAGQRIVEAHVSLSGQTATEAS